MSPEEAHKRRNYQVVGVVGGFMFPVAGLIGAGVFYANEMRDLAVTTLIGSLAGAVFYAVLFL